MKAPLSVAVMVSGLAVFSASLEAQSRFVYTNDDLSTGTPFPAFCDTNGALARSSQFTFFDWREGNRRRSISRRIASLLQAASFCMHRTAAPANISAFSIDPNQGGLRRSRASPYPVGATGFGDISLAASPDGQFLFAGVGTNNTVVRFSINADGSLVLRRVP